MLKQYKSILLIFLVIIFLGCYGCRDESGSLAASMTVTSQTTQTDIAYDSPLPTPTRDARCAFGGLPDSGYIYDDNIDPEFWEISTLQDEGFDVEIMQVGADWAETSPSLHSILIVRNDRIVFENYYNGSARQHSRDVASISKSVLSALVGIAIQDGYLEGVRTRVSETLPEYFQDGQHEDKLDLQLRHMLTMESGLHWVDDYLDLPPIERERDRLEAILNLPMDHSPGTVWQYNTGLTHLMSGILARATGMNTCQFAFEHLFDPLGIDVDYWEKDPQGIYVGGYSMFFTTRELAKFGLLYLHGGYLNDQQIIPVEWVAESLQRFASVGFNVSYGYWWWLYEVLGYPVYTALGFGHQVVHIVPEFNMVVVITNNHVYNNSDKVFDSLDYLARFVIPAILNHDAAH